ncbi:MAG: glycosyltransferase involved in cell wall biosynthesis [Arenicella sp.]|jgi:glycosyltransferase involved in cell wall biosynthesis
MPRNSSVDILHICKVYLPIRGGVQKVVQSISSLTNAFNHHVLTTGEDGAVSSQTIDGATITRCRSYLEIASMPIAPSIIGQTIKQAKKCQLICVHYPFPLADLALMMTVEAPPIIVYWHSNIVVQKKLKWLTYPLVYLTLRRAKVIVVTSERMIENSTLLTRFREKVKIIPYGLSAVDRVQASDEILEDYFVLVARHVSYKGIEIAIQALGNIDTRLVIVGDGPLYEQHKLLAKTFGLGDKVTFKKNASDNEVMGLIQNSIALIIPSVMHNEAFGLVQLEAMRLRKPVINTSLPSTVPMIARHQKEGLTIEPNNSDALAQAMLQMASDRPWVATLGNNGYQRFNEKFTDIKFKLALDALFEELLASQK